MERTSDRSIRRDIRSSAQRTRRSDARCCEDFGLDQLLIIPAHRPPHKGAREIAGDYHRFAMAVLASLDEPRVLVSTLELEAPDRPYTFETIDRLRSEFGSETRLFFVMGADSFEELNTWREPARLLSSTNLIVVTRPGHEVETSHLDERFRSTVVDLRGRESDWELDDDSNEHRILFDRLRQHRRLVNGDKTTSARRRVDCGPSAVASGRIHQKIRIVQAVT